MTTISCFLTIKYELSNTLNHVCFEKMPRSWEFAHSLYSLDEGEIRKPPEIVPVPICSRHKNQSVFTIPKMDELLEDSPAKRLADVRK